MLPDRLASTRSSSEPATADSALVPAVPIAESVQPDHIVCLEDGRTFKTMTRHLRAVYGLSPAEYRTKWGLPDDYPMVAPESAARRKGAAKAAAESEDAADPAPIAAPPVPEAEAAPVTAPAEPTKRRLSIAQPAAGAEDAAPAAPRERRRLTLALPKRDADAAPSDAGGEAGERPVAPIPPDLRALFAMAIRKRHCVRWTYNQTEMLAAPLILYTDRGELYVDAIAKEKNGAPARYEKIGRFKAAGLSAVSATVREFAITERPDPADPRYKDGVIAKI